MKERFGMYGVYMNGCLKEQFDNPIDAYETAKNSYEKTGVFHEVRLVSAAINFKVGDKVKHIEYPYYGTGTVQEISKSGKRVYVRWGDDWDRKRLLWDPYGGYYRPDKLEKIE